MSDVRRLLVLLFLIPHLSVLQAQSESTLRSKSLSLADTVYIDSLIIWPGTTNIQCADGSPISLSTYTLDPIGSYITFQEKPPCEQITVTYRILPKAALQRYAHKDYNKFVNPEEGFVIDPFVYRPGEREGVFELEGFSYSGNLERGFTFGSSQNLSLSSAFNLQLQGEIAPGVQLTAALTDNNIPIQPNGNTQNIQEFDQVFIEVKTAGHRVVLGDYRVRNPAGYFLKYNKRLQGGRYEGQFFLADSFVKMTPQMSIAFSGGKFSRNEFRGQEGNQGPYKLTGADNEPFIIVLAGTERVYINGQRLERGADRDYIIDYNLGEVRFTPNRIITQDLRIIVEFEYAIQSYAHSMIHVGMGIDVKDWGLDVHYYSEQDNKSKPLNQSLTIEDQRFLESVGDDVDNLFAPGGSLVENDQDRVLYELIDTTVNSVLYDSVYRAAPLDLEFAYAVSFSFVGAGQGNYRIAATGVNGRVYEWIAPVDGVPQGDYEAIKRLISPKRNQLLTLGLRNKDLFGGKFKAEVGLSSEDLNRFSRIDSENDGGWSGRVSYDKNWTKDPDKTSVSTDAFYEYKNSDFRPIERYRPVEFDRNFGLQGTADSTNEHWAAVDVGLGFNEKGALNYELSGFFREGDYQGVHQTLSGLIQGKGWRWNVNSTLLTSAGYGEDILFARPFFDLSYAPAALKGWRFGLDMQNEWNARRISDTLSDQSFKYQQYKIYLQAHENGKVYNGLSYMLRYEHYSAGEKFSNPLVRTHTVNYNGKLLGIQRHKLNWTLTYRYYEDDRITNQNEPLKNYYLGRIRYDGYSKQNWIRWNTVYEIGAGQRERSEFAFVQVQDGQGDYQWIDNGDGIPTEDEFFISPFPDQNNFIRIPVPTGEFVPVQSTRLNQVIGLTPGSVWRGKKGIKGFLARFSDQATLQLDKELFSDPIVTVGDILNPFSAGVNDTLLVSLNVLARNTLFFNRSNPKFQMEYTAGVNSFKQLQTNGFESRRIQNHRFGFRWNFARNFSFNGQFDHSVLNNRSDFFQDRRYTIHENGLEGGFAYLRGNVLRFDVKYGYDFQSNAFPTNGGQFSVGHKIDLEGRFKRVGKSTTTTRFTVRQLGYSDPIQNTQVEFQMLQNLRPGTNFVWQIIFERQITDYLQITLEYDGRAPANSEVVHVGRAFIRAVF